MEITTRVVANNRIIVASLNEIDFERAREGLATGKYEFYLEFEKLLRGEIYSYPSKRLDPPPHLIIDVADTNATMKEFDKWMRPIVLHKSTIVLNHRGITVFSGIQGKSQWWGFEPTLDGAIHLLTDAPGIETDLELFLGDKTKIQNLKGIYFVGCPDNDIHGLVEDFARFGLDVHHGPPAQESDFVIFCLSTMEGVSEGTKLAVEECRNRSFEPLCIIQTNSLDMQGDSFTEMGEYEAKDLISTIIDSEQAHELPVFQDIDPTLVSKVVSLAGNWPELKDLNGLELDRTIVNDLSPLAELKKLEELSFAHTQVSDLSPLAGLKNLELLTLFGTRVSDLSPLAELTNLELLDLAITGVSDLSSLAKLKNLKELHLWESQVRDLSPLAELENLRWLELNDTKVSDLSSLAELDNLRWLNLSRTQVSDLSGLAELDNLKDLELSGTQVSDLSPLRELKKLSFLFLWETNVSKEQVQELQRALPNCKIGFD